MKKNSSIKIIIDGEGQNKRDASSPDDPNYSAEENNKDRANAIRTELIKRGVDDKQITIGEGIYNSPNRTVSVTIQN